MSDDQEEIIQSDTKSISISAESESKDVEPRPSEDSQKNENTTEAKVESNDLISVEENSPDEIFEFSDSWKGNIPLVVVPTSYGSVTNDELIAHKIKIVIFANQTLRIAHSSMSRLLKKLNAAQSLDEVDEEMSSMEEIFNLQKMFELNSQEKDIEEKLKKLGYIS